MILGAKIIVTLAGAYLATGLVVGVAFLLFQVEKQDPACRGAYAFRPLLLPGLALLWPIVLLKWASRGQTGAPTVTTIRHKRAHRLIWSVLMLFIAVILGIAVSIRSHSVPETPSLRLSQDWGGFA